MPTARLHRRSPHSGPSASLRSLLADIFNTSASRLLVRLVLLALLAAVVGVCLASPAAARSTCRYDELVPFADDLGETEVGHPFELASDTARRRAGVQTAGEVLARLQLAAEQVATNTVDDAVSAVPGGPK